jgi:MFS family permease
MVVALIAMPFFGWWNDHRDPWKQILGAYGLRFVSALTLFLLKTPSTWAMVLCSIGMIVGSNLEGIASYAFWVKRIPKDIRAVTNGYRSSIARTGQLVISLSVYSILTNK